MDTETATSWETRGKSVADIQTLIDSLLSRGDRVLVFVAGEDSECQVEYLIGGFATLESLDRPGFIFEAWLGDVFEVNVG